MRTSKSLLIAALTLTVAAPSVLSAQGWDRRGSDRSDQRCDTRYDARRVAVLAHELEETATWIRREAERNNRRPDRWEAQMLYELRDLSIEAGAFHDRVESRRGDSYRGSGDFDDLARAYRQTWTALDRVNQRPYIDRGMERIGALLSELSGYYGRSRDFRYSRGRYDHDRYDHDRDGRGRYDHDRDGRGRYDRDGWNDRRDDRDGHHRDGRQ